MKEYLCLLEAEKAKELKEWERVRWLGFMMISISPDIKQAYKPKRPSDLFKLPTDEVKSEKVIVTENDIETLKRIGLFK